MMKSLRFVGVCLLLVLAKEGEWSGVESEPVAAEANFRWSGSCMIRSSLIIHEFFFTVAFPVAARFAMYVQFRLNCEHEVFTNLQI